MGRPHLSRCSSCPPMHSAPILKALRSMLSMFLSQCFSDLASLLILLPLTLLPIQGLPSLSQCHLCCGSFPIHGRAIVSSNGFLHPFRKHYFPSLTLILYHSYFCKDLFFLLQYEVYVGWGHILSLDSQHLTQVLGSNWYSVSSVKKVMKGNKIFIICHSYLLPIHSYNHRLIHKMSMNGACHVFLSF